MRKKWSGIAFGVTLMITIGLSSCGTSSSVNSNSVAGNWTGSLTNGAGQTAFAFTMSLNQAADNTVTETKLAFTSGAPCFQNASSGTGTFTLNGNFNGRVTNELQLTVVGSEPGQLDFNTLTLAGAVSGGTISGSWALQGAASGCTGSGTFTMNRS